MEDLKDYPAERVAAYESACKANKRKMEKVYSVNRFWKDLRSPNADSLGLSDEQMREVEAFWGKYSFAYRNDPYTQEYYSAISGRFDPRYVSEGIQAYYLYRFYDSPTYHTAFHDKNYREFLFKEFPISPAVVHRVRGYWYDSSFSPVTYDQAIHLLMDYLEQKDDKLIVKPTPGGGGNGITFLRRGDSAEKISAQLDAIKGDDVIIEQFMRCHPSYAVANPTSLNSLRIISFLYEGEFEIIAVVFRMGAEGKEVDNFTQGGVACLVNADGVCGDFGMDHFGKRYTEHPNGFHFPGHQLVGVDRAMEFVRKLHYRVPQFCQMSWDVAVIEDGTPILIEMNPRGDIGVYQVFGPLPYGKRTEEILDDFLLTLYYNLGANRDWDFKEYHDHIVLTKYAGKDKIVKVPETINEKTVTTIAAGCFSKGSGISEIIIPGNVKSFPDGLEKTFHTTILEDTRGIVIPAPKELKTEMLPDGILLSWTPIEGVTNYRIFRTDRRSNKKLLKNASSCVCTWKDRNILQDEIYYYEVYGYDSSVGMMSDESASSFAPNGDHEQFRLRAPENIRGTALPGRNILRWTPVEGAVGYYIYRMKLGEEMRFLTSVNSETLSYEDKDVIKGEIYHYEIRTAGFFGVLSNEAGHTAICAVDEERFRLSAPKSIRGTASPGRITLRWTPVEGAIGYYIYRMKLGEEMRFLTSVNNEPPSYTDEDVITGEIYHYKIRTVGSFGVLSNEGGHTAICAAGEKQV